MDQQRVTKPFDRMWSLPRSAAHREHIKWSNRGPLHQISKLACHEINSCQDWNNNNNEKSNRQAMQFSIFAVQRKKHLNGNWVTVWLNYTYNMWYCFCIYTLRTWCTFGYCNKNKDILINLASQRFLWWMYWLRYLVFECQIFFRDTSMLQMQRHKSNDVHKCCHGAF